MTEEKNSNDILTLFKRCKINNYIEEDIKEKNIPSHDDKVFKSIMNQFLKSKNHIDVVKKIDTGDYTKEYFEENLPQYSPKLHAVLEKCSNKKTHDDKLVLKQTTGNYVLRFGGTPPNPHK